LNAWRQHCRREVDQSSVVVAMCVRRMLNASLAAAFATWHDAVAEARQQRQKLQQVRRPSAGSLLKVGAI
jgi:hypothetical protein